MGKMNLSIRFPMIYRQNVDRTGDVRGVQTSSFFSIYSNQSLPTDPVGNVVISFNGVKDGSEIKIFDIDKTLLNGTDSTSGIPSYILPRYAPGSAYNTVRILIINLGYEVIDLTYVLPTVNSTIPVFQRIDRNYRNPS